MIIKKLFLFATFLLPAMVQGKDNTPAFKVFGKATTMEQVAKEHQSALFEIEEKKFRLIEESARKAYLDDFFEKLAKKSKTSVGAAREKYIASKVKISDKEIAETLEKFKDHPQLSKMPKDKQRQQVKDFLTGNATRKIINDLIEEAISKKQLTILYPRPQEPVFSVSVTKEDHVRYGPNATDTKPLGCKGDACPITIVEYSEFQCPFCSRVIPDVKRLLTKYKGKMRWIVRDFPLSFHDRAKPAALTAKCAANQGKYWQMYEKLFANQRKLSDSDLEGYAKEIGLNMATYKKCTTNPKVANDLIDKNFRSGAALGVTGTPAFFINGRRLSGALPYSEFDRVIKDELTKKKKS